MATNPNMVAIETVTVPSGGAASIEFTSIPQTYTDLKIVLSGRTTQASLADTVYFSFNSSTSNFSSLVLYGDGTGVSRFTQARYAGSQPGSTATANTFANIELYIPNYTSSNNKSYSVDAVSENNATTAYAYLGAGLWSNTSAITSITLTPNAGSFVEHSSATLYGVTSAQGLATGGFVTSDANYYYHTFTASGTFTPLVPLTVDYLVVAGGGGGGWYYGGGGAGGLRCTVGATGGGGSLESPLSLTAQAYAVTIGAGGAAAIGGRNQTNGSNSSFSTITSTGGGRGGTGDTGDTGSTGGSGGGAGGWNNTARTGNAGTANQGFAGGDAPAGDKGAGGGGGAGAVGGNGTVSPAVGGNGGDGVQTSISGTATYYAGGGGGGSNTGTGGTGGLGGGGRSPETTGNGVSGTVNTGGGGGAVNQQYASWNSGAGGSGIVIVRYAK